MIPDVDIVSAPSQAVASLRCAEPLSRIGDAMRRLRSLLTEAGLKAAGPLTARCRGEAGPEQVADHEAAVSVAPRTDGSIPDAVGEARGEWVPAHQALEAVHHGRHDDMDDAWTAVRQARAAPAPPRPARSPRCTR
jgi:effector-binding domain-containing protein